MFTGIITHLGTVVEKKDKAFLIRSGADLIKRLKEGMSISVNGTCLTVTFVSPAKKVFRVEVMPETFQKTMLGKLKKGSLVNIELPASVKSLLAGHIVQGHIDGKGEIREIKRVKNSRLLKIAVPRAFAKYIVPKGPIAVNGISLTVIGAEKSWFSVSITPYTWEHTTLKTAGVGDEVNIEVDVLAKYLERLLNQAGTNA